MSKIYKPIYKYSQKSIDILSFKAHIETVHLFYIVFFKTGERRRKVKKILVGIFICIFLVMFLGAADSSQHQEDGFRFGKQNIVFSHWNNTAAGDLNGDGYPDIIRVHPDFPNRIWFNTGDGNFSEGPALDSNSKSYATVMGDVDGDGTMDIVIGNRGPNTIWFNRGPADFVRSSQTFGHGFTTIIVLSDIDRDMDRDILSFNRDSGLVIWFNDGNGHFSPGQSIRELFSTLRVFLIDVNKDGNPDMMVKRYHRPDSVWCSDGNGFFTESSLEAARFPVIRTEGTDFTGDRIPDTVMFDKNNIPRLNNKTGKDPAAQEQLSHSPSSISVPSSSVRIINPSFETGDLSGWSLFDMADPFLPMQALRTGTIWWWWFYNPIAPIDGNWLAINGFDGGGPGVIHLRQRVLLPENKNVLKFNYRAGWDMYNFGGSTQLRSFYVNIQPVEEPDNELRKVFLIARPNTVNNDTGLRTGTLDMSQFSGKKVNLSFKWWVPEPYTGPGEFHLDNIRIFNTTLDIEITSPENNEFVYGMVPVTTSIIHDSGITGVEFYIDGELVETRREKPFTHDWDTAGYAEGEHTIRAVVKDDIGAQDSDSIQVELMGPTSIKIISPADQSTVAGPNKIHVLATDQGNVDRVTYYLDGNLLGESTAAPFDLSWESTLYPNGSHTLKAIAHYKTGETAEDSANITIDNIVLDLRVTRYKVQAWIVRKDYAGIQVNMTGGNPAMIDKLVIYRKDSGDFSPIHQFNAGDFHNGEYNYEDRFLDAGKSYTYKVVALDAYGGTIGVSQDTTI